MSWPPFSFALETEIRFGVGVRREVGRAVAQLGRRVVLVTGRRWFDAHQYGRELLEALEDHEAQVCGRVIVEHEPDDAAVRAGADAALHSRAEVLLAVGGGSALDLAKASGLVAGGIDLESAFEGKAIHEPTGPGVVAVPTTSGTGSEVSQAAIVLHRRTGRKRAVRGRGVAPRAAFVDPELVITAGPRVTAESGFDAAAHAIETSVSLAASPINVLAAGDALRRLLEAVVDAMRVPSDLAAREQAAYAALLMGINLATASTCLPHRLQYPLGAMTGTTHARGVAALMPAWLARTRHHAPERLAALAVAARLATDEDPVDQAASRLIETVEGWLDEIGMRIRLRDLGVGQNHIPGLVAAVEGTLKNDPGPSDDAALAELYESSV